MIAAAAFVLGVYLCIRMLAALYRLLDLWYTIETAWPSVARAILGWGAATAATALVLPARPRQAFLWGLVTYLVFYVVAALVLSRIVLPRLAARSGSGSDT